MLRRKLHLGLRRLGHIVLSPFAGQWCSVCGAVTARLFRDVSTADLIEQWALQAPWVDWFKRREGILCMRCLSSPRVQHMASALQATLSLDFGRSFKSLDDITQQPEFQRLRIAEINSVGTVHRFLARCPQLQYSE